jgi:putative ABC transport system permease protein
VRRPSFERCRDVLVEAFRSCQAYPLRSTLGALAVAAAIATETLVITAVDGVARYAKLTAARTFGADTFVLAKVASPGQLSRRELAARLERNPPIRRSDLRFLERHSGGRVLYAPSAQRAAEVTAFGRTYETALITGTSSTLADIRELDVTSGRFFSREEETSAALVAVIGAEVADALFPGLDPLGRSVRVGGRGFEVIGLQSRQGTAGGASLDRYVWIPLQSFERIFGAPETLLIFGRAGERERTTSAEDRARATLRARRQLRPGTEDNFDLLAPEAARSFVLRISERVGAAAPPISAMALFAAVVVITNTTLVSVTQRTREIGVRRAVGATRRQIMMEVLAESTLVAIAGGVVGIAATAGIVALVSRALSFELTVDSSAVFWGFTTATLSGLAAGWYPARRASNVDVISALRLE